MLPHLLRAITFTLRQNKDFFYAKANVLSYA